jgi:hypothetical protein
LIFSLKINNKEDLSFGVLKNSDRGVAPDTKIIGPSCSATGTTKTQL